MKDQDRVALARIVLTNREHVIAIEPLGKGLLGTTLRYPYELRDESDYFDDIKSPKISKDMIELASHILDTKAAHFDPSKFKDEYENALKALVRRKASGKPIKVGEREEKPDNVINLMDALKASLKGKPAAKRRAAAPAPGTGATARRRRRIARRRGSARRGDVPRSSWPGLTRPSTTYFLNGAKNVDARDKPGHDELRERARLPLRLPLGFLHRLLGSFLRRLALLRRLLRHLLALGPRLGQADRDRLLAARDLLARTSAPQCAGLALFHCALNVIGCFL